MILVKMYKQILLQSDSVFPAENMKAAYALARLYGMTHYNPKGDYDDEILPYYDQAIGWAKFSRDSVMTKRLIDLREIAKEGINYNKKQQKK